MSCFLFKSRGTAQCGQINKQVPKRKALTAMSCTVCDMSLLLSTSLFQLSILKLEKATCVYQCLGWEGNPSSFMGIRFMNTVLCISFAVG